MTREQIEQMRRDFEEGLPTPYALRIALCDLALSALAPAEPVANDLCKVTCPVCESVFATPEMTRANRIIRHSPREVSEERIREIAASVADQFIDAIGYDYATQIKGEAENAIRTALRESGTAQGFVSVPVEPTEAMIKAAYAACTCAECGGIGAIYKAMLAAKQSGVDHE